MCSLYVPLVFLTSIDPPAFSPCWYMNRMKAAVKEPVTDIMSLQTFIKLPFILLLRPPQASYFEFSNAHSVPGTPEPREWSSTFEFTSSLKLVMKCFSKVGNKVWICSFCETVPTVIVALEAWELIGLLRIVSCKKLTEYLIFQGIFWLFSDLFGQNYDYQKIKYSVFFCCFLIIVS